MAAVVDVQTEITRAGTLGQRLEDLIFRKQQCHPSGDRDLLLIGYWSFLVDCHGGILTLLKAGNFGAAFALMRPVIEALIRAHVVLAGKEDDVLRIQRDEYRVNFGEIGPQIDAAFDLDHFFENFLKERTRNALHSYTHAGMLQLGRRFDGDSIKPRYSEAEIVEVIRTATIALLMVTALLTKRLGFEEEWKATHAMFEEYGK